MFKKLHSLNKNKGFALPSILVASLISAIVLTAFMSFVRASTNAIVRTRELGARDDLRNLVRAVINCPLLRQASEACQAGEALEIRTTSNQVLVPSNPTLMQSSVLSGLPFLVRAICDTRPEALTRFRIEVVPRRTFHKGLSGTVRSGHPKWEVLFANVPPC